MRPLVFIAFFFGTLTGFTQTPDYFAGNPEWRLRTECAISYLPGLCIETQNFVYYLNGDTLLNGNNYHRLFKRGESTFFNYEPNLPGACSGSETFNNEHILLRQDGKKILRYDHPSQPDEVIYDFGMQIGDTIPMTGHITVESIDTIEFAGGSRLRFWLNGAQSQHLIEGIGHDLGFLLPIQNNYLECGYEFACFKQFDDTLHFPSQTISCDFSVDVLEVKPTISRFYPNPCADQITLEMAQWSDIDRITAFDVNGRQVNLTYKTVDNLTYQIESSGLLTGFYLLKVVLKNGDPLTLKTQKK